MLKNLLNVFKIAELKNKVLFTAFILVLYRLAVTYLSRELIPVLCRSFLPLEVEMALFLECLICSLVAIFRELPFSLWVLCLISPLLS